MSDMQSNKKVFMIAFHFPPDASIGAQRTFKTAEYLPQYGWDPIILTAKESAYGTVEKSQDISKELLANTHRTAALDVHRHLTIKGKHLGWMSIIDRWTTWVPGAIWKGLKLIKQQKPDLIWSTAPIPSAHIIAAILSKISGIPWVADYRDPFSYHHTLVSKIKTKILKKIDKVTVKTSTATIFTTPKTTELYRNYFHDESTDKFNTVENGYDEQNWSKLSSHKLSSKPPLSKDKFSLLYSGVLYPNGRDPTPLFFSIQSLKLSGVIADDNFELIFQGAGDGKNYEELIESLKITNMVKFTPSVPYLDSLACLKEAGALVIIQGQIFNYQVPGKLYEYIKSAKPIIVMTPNDSSTALAALQHPLSAVVNTPDEITEKLLECIKGNFSSPHAIETKQFSRQQKASEMAVVFNRVANTNKTQNRN
jgi:glycosyltransferase involved in cell wall biosynthesis